MKTLLLLVGMAMMPAASFGEAKLSIVHTQSRIEVHGTSSSDGHEAIIERTLKRDFEALSRDMRWQRQKNLPPAWSLATDLALRAIAKTLSGTAELTATEIAFHGYTLESEDFDAAVGNIRNAVGDTFSVTSYVEAVPNSTSLRQYCQSLFESALRRTRVSFVSGDASLNSNAYPALDRLLELAAECPGATIDIRGAVDSPFGQQRADSVARYLAENGLPDQRYTTGVAAPVPLQTVYISVRP